MRKIVKNVLVFSSYFVYEILFVYLLIALGINYTSFSYTQKINCIFIINILYICFLVFMYRKELKQDLLDFKENYKKYLIKYFSQQKRDPSLYNAFKLLNDKFKINNFNIGLFSLSKLIITLFKFYCQIKKEI